MSNAIRSETGPSMSGSFKNSAALFIAFSCALMIACSVLRIMEFVHISLTNDLPPDFRNVALQAILFDGIVFFESLPFLVIPFFILSRITGTERSRYRAYGVYGSLLIVAYAVLIKYFATALVPLGADLFGYSLGDIAETIKGSATIDILSIFLFIIPITLFWISLALLRTRTLMQPLYAIVLVGAGFVMTWSVSPLPDSRSFKTDLSYHLALNKAAYFAKESSAYIFHSQTPVTAIIRPGDGRRSGNAGEFKYVDPEYPFLRTDETPDVLGKFFNVDAAAPPNIVLILVEGLGKAFSGPNAYLGSFTPFLDELGGKSLYWENFLASQGRTFAALPSILASLPFAEQGFNDLGKRMPRHLSLMSILKHNGYRIKYCYGGDLNFDNHRLFLKRQGADVLVGIDDFDKKYAKNPGTSWGYADREIMMQALDMDRKDPAQPYISFVQTISMHPSYSVPGQERYLDLFEERMKTLGFGEAQKESHRQYKQIYSTILYTDDALRFYLEQYAKLPAYRNTIFIITGDHRLPEIPLSTKIDRFHVPLIIFSPLLKRTAHIESISSHLDIAPSLLAFLRKNYHIDAPATVSWVGSGLDMDPSFRNIHHYPLKHTKTNLIDYISGMYFLDQDVLFSLGKYMDLEPIQNEEKKKALIAEFDRYKALNDRFSRELKLIPDSLYEQYRPKER